MASTGWVLPTASYEESGDGTWTDTSNIHTDDGTEATFSLTSKNTAGKWAVGWTFGFDSLIPAGATISKVEIRADWRVNTTSGIAHLELAAQISGAIQTTYTNSAEPTTLTTDTFDITADRTWTRDNLLDAVLELKVRGRNGNSTTDPSYRVDHIAVQVEYSTSKKRTIAALLARRALTFR